jgi:hypothetical protein
MRLQPLVHRLSGDAEVPGDFPRHSAAEDGVDCLEAHLFLDEGGKRARIENSHFHISPFIFLARKFHEPSAASADITQSQGLFLSHDLAVLQHSFTRSTAQRP